MLNEVHPSHLENPRRGENCAENLSTNGAMILGILWEEQLVLGEEEVIGGAKT